MLPHPVERLLRVLAQMVAARRVAEVPGVVVVGVGAREHDLRGRAAGQARGERERVVGAIRSVDADDDLRHGCLLEV